MHITKHFATFLLRVTFLIIDDLISDSKLTNYERVIDRKEAIYRALSIAEEDDIVFITGKGRDNYMALGKEYLPYSDYEVIKSYFIKW